MGPKRATKPAGPKHLCVYLVELDESTSTGVQDDTLCLLRQCVMDKIFSENPDDIAICRSDMISTVQFVPANWDALRTVENTFRETKLPEKGTKGSNCVETLLDLCEVLISQAGEDSYEETKILFFGHLNSQDLKEKEVKRLAEKILQNSITISFILSDEEHINDVQKQNLSLLKGVFELGKYNEWGYVTSNNLARRQIMNTLTKKPTRPSPWNVVMEIGSDIKIAVSGYLCTRKNKVGEMTKGLMKSVPVSKQQDEKQTETTNDAPTNAPESTKKTVVMEVAVAKTVTEKEIVWKEKDGSVVGADDIGKGFLYGDRVVPFNELENEDVYQSGEKCLKILVFSPSANIKPGFQLGDGTTLFYPKKDDVESQLKFDALLKALHKNNRVAVVRKVYLKNKRVNIGVLSPDMDRMCLVFSEVCFADDVSVPHFASLIKEAPNVEGITRQEEIIDDLITAMSIDEFYPGDGPVDPAVSIMRQNVACRILEPGQEEKKPWGSVHGIDIFFDKIVLKDDLLSRLKESFPLTVNKEEGDRPAGANIFRKRYIENDQNGSNDRKKIKAQTSEDKGAGDIEAESGLGTMDEDVDEDYLLDQL